MPSAIDGFRFKYDSPTGMSAEQLNQLFTFPRRRKSLSDGPPLGHADRKMMRAAEIEAIELV
jgi:hypothetical protein